MAQGRILRVVQALQEPSWKPTASELFWQRAVSDGQQLIHQSLREGLGGVDQYELCPLLDDVVSNEGSHAYWKPRHKCISNCGTPLLSVYDPTWLLRLSPSQVDRDDQFP